MNKKSTFVLLALFLFVGCDKNTSPSKNENPETEYQKGYLAGEAEIKNDQDFQKFLVTYKKEHSSDAIVVYKAGLDGAIDGTCTVLTTLKDNSPVKKGASQEYVNGFQDGCIATKNFF